MVNEVSPPRKQHAHRRHQDPQSSTRPDKSRSWAPLVAAPRQPRSLPMLATHHQSRCGKAMSSRQVAGLPSAEFDLTPDIYTQCSGSNTKQIVCVHVCNDLCISKLFV